MVTRKGVLHWAPWGAGGVLLASLLVAGWAYNRDHDHQHDVEHERSVIVTSERLLSALKDVETGQRGFIITGRDSYLDPYDAGRIAAPSALARLVGLIGADVDQLEALIAARMKEAADGIETYRRDGANAGVASINAGSGKALMDAVRERVGLIQGAAEDRIAATRREQSVDDAIRLASVIGFVTSCVLLAGLALLRRREQQASQRLFEGVLENAPIGLGILDRTLKLRHLNHALAEMSERALSAEPGMSLWDVVPQMRGSLEPRLKGVLDGGGVASAVFTAASNQRAQHTRSYEATFYPLRQADEPSADGVGMVIADVTARKRAERSTRESEERFRSLVQASAAMVWTADKAGAFVEPQPSWTRFTGQPTAESLGWGRLKCLHPDDVEATRDAWAVATANASPIALEHRVRRADGAWRHMALSVAPVHEEDGSVREWVGSHTDISDRKETELALAAAKDAAESANRAKSVFLANMSHELRTPLSAVIGYSEMLEEEAEESGETSMLADLGRIKSNAKHLLSLINDVLDLSKVEANKMSVYVEEVDVGSFTKDAASTVEALVERKGNVLTVELADGVGSMRTDVVKLRQCLFNLLSNAAKFTENGMIALAVKRQVEPGRDWLVFEVRDTGIGMTPEQLARLFQRFSQADETTTRKFGGTGLGLALSRAFARLLGGDIHVESVEGHGSRFTVRVPAEVEAHDPAAEPEAEPDVEDGPARARDLVLVIDDEAAQRDLTTRFLQRQGFAVRSAPDGAAGLQLARTLAPRAILLDVMMPGMDGWSVLKALKADPATAEIPVVMVSFVAEDGISTTLGAVEAVPKPVDWTRLRQVMEQFRDSHGDVLVVDDDADLRQRLRAVLEKNGWTVMEASNGAEAIECVERAPPRLILLDLTMPVMDGFSFLHRLRGMPGCGEIPVVVLSARDMTRAEEKSLDAADRIFKKGETSMRALTAELRRLDGERHPAT